MSERNYSLGPHNDESLSWSVESDEEKSKKEKQKQEEKLKRRNKKRDESAKIDNESSEQQPTNKSDAKNRKRPAFLADYLGVEKVSETQTEKRQAKKESADATSRRSPEGDAKNNPEDARRLREKLDETETIEATEAYILARRRQLDTDSARENIADEATAESGNDTAEDGHASANRANVRFLEALRRNLRLRRTPPDESMLEAALVESQDDRMPGAGDLDTFPEDQESIQQPENQIQSTAYPEKDELPIDHQPPSGELADDTVVHLSERATPEPAAENDYDSRGGVDFRSPTPASVRPSNQRSPRYPVSAERLSSRSSAGDFLLGGFVGYLLGKRRGRIKSEEQLEPVRASLEQEVSTLEQTIRRYEDRARLSSQEQPRASLPDHDRAAQETDTTSVEQAAQKASSEKTRVDEAKPETETSYVSQVDSASSETATRLSRQVLEQSESAAHVQQKTVEHLTGMGVAREAISYQSGATESRGEDARPSLTPERIDTMPTSSLLRHVESIRYNQTDIRSLFERGELSDRALRGALKEHLRGNSIENYIDKELRKQRETPEVYSPEKMRSSTPSTTEAMLPAPSAREKEKVNQFMTSSAGEGSAASASSTSPDTARDPQQLQSQRMKQASLGAVLGLVIVIILWFVFGAGGLL